MKKIVIGIVMFAFSLSSVFAQVSREEAYERVQQVIDREWEKVEVFMCKSPLAEGEKIEVLGGESVYVKASGWVFFVDEMPYANWGHDCFYAFVDKETGRVDTLRRMMPPVSFEGMEQLRRVVPLLTEEDRVLFDIPSVGGVEVSTNRYAVIISGGGSMYSNYERYWNDCSAIYKVLRNRYHYNRSKIFVLMSDGTDPGMDMHMIDGTFASSPLDLDGDGNNDIQYSATKANIATVFDMLSQRVTDNDHVFVFTTDHGGPGSTLNLWGESMTMSEFVTEVNKLSSAKSINVCMEQCFSGGYASTLSGNNRVIATACASNEPSWAMPNLVYNEFCYHWISAVAGQTPYGVSINADYNNDGFVSMEEAFQYAQTHDTRPESPQFSAPYMPNLGPYLTLSGLIENDVDLMIRDSVGDNGTVPSGVHNMWHSPDIWLEDMYGNAIANPHGNTECKVCVRITNLSDMPTYGGERLFLNWAKAGCDLRWSHNWLGNAYFNCGSEHPRKGGPIGNPDGVVIPIVPAQGSVVVKVTWPVPRAEDYQSCTQFAADLWHFCLLARVHDGETIVGENATNMGMGYFTVQNNNVAWKNVSILSSQYPRAVVTLSNPYDELRGVRLRFSEASNKGESIFKNAEIYVRFEDELTDRWREGGAGCKGGRYVGDNRFRVESEHFSLENMQMDPGRHYTMEVSVQFYAQSRSQENKYEFDFWEEIDEEVIGAEHFIAIRDREREIYAQIVGDESLNASECGELTAIEIGESAQYVWYSIDGEILGYGPHLQVCPDVTTRYILAVVAEADGYMDYDTATVVVNEAVIVALTPNPATNQAEVEYSMTEGLSEVSLIVSTATGHDVYSTMIGGLQGRHAIPLQSLPPGQYIVRIEKQGRVLDARTLLVY